MSTAPLSPLPPSVPVEPLGDEDVTALDALLVAVADGNPSLEPLVDAGMVDGFLAAVVVLPKRIARGKWMPYVLDAEGRAAPDDDETRAVRTLVERRHAELTAAVDARAWFDPWVFDGEDACYPWAAGFAQAWERFAPAGGGPAVDDALALVYRHLGPGDLDLADPAGQRVQAAIDALEPPADLADGVEQLVRATLLLADASGRPKTAPARA
jgi:uncharacterized protein